MTPSDENRTISLSSVVAVTRDQVSTDLGAETILLSMESAVYYGLDAVASRIWELMHAPIRVSEIRDSIAREYEVEIERCEADVLAFLQQLSMKGLIEVRDDC